MYLCFTRNTFYTSNKHEKIRCCVYGNVLRRLPTDWFKNEKPHRALDVTPPCDLPPMLRTAYKFAIRRCGKVRLD